MNKKIIIALLLVACSSAVIAQTKSEGKTTHSETINKDKALACVLCFAGGAVGVHRLYLHSSMGTYVYYLFFGSIVAPVDFFVMLFTPKDKFGKFIDNKHPIFWFD